MATNLRDLLGTLTSDQAGGGPDPDTLLPTFPLKDYKVQYIGPGQYMMQGNDNPTSARDSYHYTYYPNWTIPTGATDVLFEIWGGGGGGAASCCCSHGPGGGAGAYAWKQLKGADVVPGCQYQLCVATSTCRTASKSGRRGCKTYITGNGLTNFCAEGGFGGCNYCNLQGCTWLTPRRNEGSCTAGCCAIYYGADGGAIGLPGAYYAICYGNRCHNKFFFPYPGGLVSSQGGYVSNRHHCGHCNCHYCEWCHAKKIVGYGQGNWCHTNGVPGMGGVTASSCNNGPMCGSGGNGGMIRISYK